MNIREELEGVAEWLSFQNEDLSFGLKTAEDALKLSRHWQADPDLPEYADGKDCYSQEELDAVVANRIAAVGYDPMAANKT